MLRSRCRTKQTTKTHDAVRLEAKLKDKRASRDNLIERCKAAEANAFSLREKARKLAADGADDAALSAAESAMRRDQDRAATLGDALGDVETTIGNLEREIVQIIDQRCRAETAAAVTALADKWATMGAAFDAVVGGLADLARESATIIPDARPLRVFLEAVKQQVPPEAGLVSSVLRDHAKAVLAGTAPASLPKPEAECVQLSVVEPPLVEVVNTADPVLAAANFQPLDRGPDRVLKVRA